MKRAPLTITTIVLLSGCFQVGGDPAGPPGGADSGPVADSGGGTDTSTAADSSVRDTGGPPRDTGTVDSGGGDTGVADTATPTDTGTSTNCPDVFGAFSIASATGLGCGDLDTSAPQRIDGDRVACVATFTGAGGLAGSGTISAAGALSGASLSLGSAAPTSCTGNWTAVTSTWMLQCGAAGPSRCNVQLARTGS